MSTKLQVQDDIALSHDASQSVADLERLAERMAAAQRSFRVAK